MGLSNLFKSKDTQKREKLLKDYQEGIYLKISKKGMEVENEPIQEVRGKSKK